MTIHRDIQTKIIADYIHGLKVTWSAAEYGVTVNEVCHVIATRTQMPAKIVKKNLTTTAELRQDGVSETARPS